MRDDHSISGKRMVEKSLVETSEIWGKKVFQDGVIPFPILNDAIEFFSLAFAHLFI